MKYVLKYVSNTERKNFGYFECNAGDILEQAKAQLKENGYEESDFGRWSVDVENGELIVCYHNIVAPYGAVGLIKIDNKFEYSIRTKEENHKQYPHIHIHWSDGDIWMSLRTETDDDDNRRSCKSSKEAKIATSFVTDNLDKFQKAWKYIFEESNTQKAKALFEQSC